MKLFGITGGVGMGKSTAGSILREKQLPVIDTDILARQLVEPGQPALKEIVHLFGQELLDSKGGLRRGELARMVFGDPAKRKSLEAILHPRIFDMWRQEVERWRAQGYRAGAVIIPLLFETGAEKELDASICVACSARTQHERLKGRGWTDEQIQQRLASQLPIEEKIARSDYVVWSEGGESILAEQLEKILAPK